MKIRSFGRIAASLATVALAVAPAHASVQPRHGQQILPASALPGDAAQNRGWGGGWGGGWGRRHHDDISAGDVFAGVLVIGAIAAIASAASKGSKSTRERSERQRRDDDGWRYGDEPRNDAPQDRGHSRSLDNAVDSCVAEIDRGASRVDTVDAVNRDAEGWRVEGRTRAGAPWNCSVDGSGRIRGFSVETAQPLRN